MKRAALIGIVVVAAALRIWWNDVSEYSPADETVYSGVTRHLIDRGFIGGYPDVVTSFVTERRLQRFPTPFRYGYYALARATAAVYGSPEPHALAWLSTLAGIAVVPLLFVLGKRLFGSRTALLAAAFAAFSCIELALGRRALQDEVFCLAVLLAVTALIVALETDQALHIAGAIAAMTFAFTVKETFGLLYPALIGLAVVYRRVRLRHALLFAAPPLLWFLGFCALARDFGSFFRAARIAASAGAAPYALAYQSGPPHRPLFDLFLTAPLVSILAAAAVVVVVMAGRGYGRRERALVVFLVLAVAAFGIAPSKNLRFIVVVDPFVRLAAAWLVATFGTVASPVRLVAVAAASAAIELELFTTIFVSGGVYDPVTQTMLEALAAVPHGNVHPGALVFPWLCAAIAAAAWIVHRMIAGREPLRNAPR